MNTSQLECFVTLANTLNYVKAADYLGMTQPAVSKQIQSLEKELGAKLFDRTTRAVSLTDIGTHFLPEATSMLSTYYHTRKWISKYHDQFQSNIGIGYSDPHCVNTISFALERVSKTYPKALPQLKYDQTDSNLGQLTEGRLDMVVGMRDATFTDDNVIFQKVHEDCFHCLLSTSHPLVELLAKEGKTSVSSDILWEYRQIINIPPYLLKNYFSRGRQIVPVNDALDNIVSANTNEAYGLVLAGLGYCFVPMHLLMEHPRLVAYPWDESPSAPFGVYYRKDLSDKKKDIVRCFIKELKNFPIFVK